MRTLWPVEVVEIGPGAASRSEGKPCCSRKRRISTCSESTGSGWLREKTRATQLESLGRSTRKTPSSSSLIRETSVL